jgi:hypothetical protein
MGRRAFDPASAEDGIGQHPKLDFRNVGIAENAYKRAQRVVPACRFRVPRVEGTMPSQTAIFSIARNDSAQERRAGCPVGFTGEGRRLALPSGPTLIAISNSAQGRTARDLK